MDLPLEAKEINSTLSFTSSMTYLKNLTSFYISIRSFSKIFIGLKTKNTAIITKGCRFNL